MKFFWVYSAASFLLLVLLGGRAFNMIRLVRIFSGADLEQKKIRLESDTHNSNFVQSHLSNFRARNDGVGKSENAAEHCTREDIIDGQWLRKEMASPPYIPPNTKLRCSEMEKFLASPWETYEWKPKNSNCIFRQWNATEFCSMMTGATILIAGDSLSWEQYSSLGQLLGLRISQKAQHQSKREQRNHVQYPCNARVRLAFRRDDILTNLTDAIQSTFPEVLILNRGAHYQNDTRLIPGIERNIEEIKAWRTKCRNANIKCHLYWRTSVPGHPLCDRVNFEAPNNDLEAMETWIADPGNYNNHTIKYHWDDYQRQNIMVTEIMRSQLGEDTLRIIDAYYLNVRRPDQHRSHQGDCLHNCYPGKMDVYNQILLHYLHQDRTEEDTNFLNEIFNQLPILVNETT